MQLETQRLVQGLILAVSGMFILRQARLGQLTWYINERFAWLVLGAAMVMALFAVLIALWPHMQPDPAAHHHPTAEPQPGHEHGAGGHQAHGSLGWWVLLIGAIPVVLGFTVPARPLGASALATRGLSAEAPPPSTREAALTQFELVSTELSLLDWARVFYFATDDALYSGQRADVVGFTYRADTLAAEELILSRFVVICCAADGSAVSVTVRWPQASQWPDNTWVRVQGVMLAPPTADALPILEAESVEAVSMPAQPYLYP